MASGFRDRSIQIHTALAELEIADRYPVAANIPNVFAESLMLFAFAGWLISSFRSELHRRRFLEVRGSPIPQVGVGELGESRDKSQARLYPIVGKLPAPLLDLPSA
jgi:hypothetical protein